jgi:predicted site-specific integrase-resolvase
MIDTLELARRLEVHPVTLATWRTEGKGPRFVRVGRRVRYRMSDIERWLVENERTSTQAER